jgi:hypothetical protein
MQYAGNNPNFGSNAFFVTMLIIFLMIFGATKCKGQNIERVTRYGNRPDIVTKFPTKPLLFGDSSIVLNICTDSIEPHKQRIMVFVFFHDKISQSLKIGFENGEMIQLEPFSIDSTYVEYIVRPEQFYKMKNFRFDYLNFVGVAQCVEIVDKTFFRDFLRDL